METAGRGLFSLAIPFWVTIISPKRKIARSLVVKDFREPGFCGSAKAAAGQYVNQEQGQNKSNELAGNLEPQGRIAGRVWLAGCVLAALILRAGLGQEAGELVGDAFRITAQYGQTFRTADEENAVVLQGKVELRGDGRQIAGDKAVVWIRRLGPEGKGSRSSRVAVYVEGQVRADLREQDRRVEPEEKTEGLLVIFHTGSRIYLTAETLVDKPGTDLLIYQTGWKLRQQGQPEEVEKPVVPEVAEPVKTEGPAGKEIGPSEKPVTAEPAKPTEPVKSTEPEVQVVEMTKELESGEPVHLVPYGTFQSRKQPDGSDVFLATDGIYVYRRLVREDMLLELKAENAVIFYSQEKILRLASEKGRAEDPNAAEQRDIDLFLGEAITGVYLEGDVLLQGGEYKITTERLYYDFTRNRALIMNGTLRMTAPQNEGPIFVRAEKIRQLSLNQFSAEKVKISTDEFYKPQVSLRAQTVELTALNEKGEAPAGTEELDRIKYDIRNTTANVGEVPVFWWPRLAGEGTPAKVPLKSVHSSYDSDFGMSLETEWKLASMLGLTEPKGVDLTLRADEFSKRGPGTGVDLDYTSESNFGHVKTYMIHDSGEDRLGRLDSRNEIVPEDPLRGRATWQHRQYLPHDWQATVEISYLSDPEFLESWEEREFEYEKEQETLVYLKQQRDNWAFDFLNKWQLNDFDYTMTELPTAGHHMAGQDLFEKFTYYHDGSISRIREQAGDREVAGFGGREDSVLPDMLDQSDYALGVSRHEVGLPLQAGDFKLVPTVIGTFAYDDMNLDENHHFVQGAGGMRASTQFWHVDDTVRSRFWDLDRIRHVIIPEASAFWVDSDWEEDPSQDVFNFALRQRWQTMRGREGQKRSVDFLRLDTSVTLVNHDVDDFALPNRFYFSAPETQYGKRPILNSDLANLDLARREQIHQTLSDHTQVDWTWQMSDTTALVGDINNNLHDGDISQADLAVAVQRTPRLSYYVGTLYLRDGDPFRKQYEYYQEHGEQAEAIRYADSHFLTTGTSYQLNRIYILSLAHQYDIGRTEDAYTQVVIIRKFSHWYGAFSFGVDSIRDSLSFSVSFWPEGTEEIALGSRRYTRLTR